MDSPGRDGNARERNWTLVLIASAFLVLVPSLALISPRARGAAEPRSANVNSPQHEPPPSPLVAPRPAPEAAPAADGVLPGRESAWTAEDAAPRTRGTASMKHAADLVVLEIRVTDAGRPLAGASVELLHEPAQGPARAPAVHTADAAGLVRVELAPGTVRATAWSEASCALPTSGALLLGVPTRLELVLEPAFPVTGRVIDARTGAPLCGAEVALWTFAERDTVVSGTDGSFRHPRFPARAPAQQIAARAPGYGVAVRYLRIDAEGGWKISARSADEESIRGTGTPWVELALVPELVVRGRVLDEHGQPLAEARVSAEGYFHALAAVATRDRAETESAADGRFELGGLRSDIGHSLLVEAAGRAPALLELAAGPTLLDAGELVLARETVLAGVVIDAQGQPLAGVEVVLRATSAAAPPFVPGGLDVPARIEGRERRVTTAPEGTFVFEGLAAHPVTLTVESASGARAELELEPRPDGSFESPCLTLWPRPVSVAERSR